MKLVVADRNGNKTYVVRGWSTVQLITNTWSELQFLQTASLQLSCFEANCGDAVESECTAFTPHLQPAR